MNNIFTYVEWRKDLTLKQSEFNNIDNLILTQLSYLFWENIVDDNLHHMVCFSEAAEKFLSSENLQKQREIGFFCSEDTIKLLEQIYNSPRYRNMFMTGYVTKTDEETEEQFSAVTFLLEDGSIYVAYRGTDSTLVGWKEDFNMSFMETVPSQISASEYLAEVISVYGNRKIRTGGHSKGGNLAVYAGVFTEGTKDRVIDIYCNDGPGFMPQVIQDSRYKEMEDRIHSFVPQSSIIGMILEHEEPYNIVHSESVGILQHDAYNWNVTATDFVYTDDTTFHSRTMDGTLRDMVIKMSDEEKEKFVDTIFDIFKESGITMTSELRHSVLKNGYNVIKTINGMENEERQALNEGLKTFFRILVDNIKPSH